jgi:RND superfamily putative drug exporter
VFARLGPWCHDRRKLVLGLWIGALILLFGTSSAVGNAFHADFNLPNAESSKGIDVLKDSFGGRGAGIVGTIVFKADQGVDDPEVKAAMTKLFDKVEGLKGVSRVESPYGDGDQAKGQISHLGDETGKIAFANVEMPADIEIPDAVKVRDELQDSIPKIEGLRVELGGYIFAAFESPSSEALGIAFAIVILIIAFGSVLAMGLPVGVALFGIGIGTTLVTFISHLMSVPDFATFIGVMIGLGVGIDYALLIITRYREQLHAGHDVRESIGIAMDTAGRSVFFAGITVVISLLGMLLMGVAFIQGLGVGAAAVVAVTVAASLTLLPALLGFAGQRIERTRYRGLIAAGFVAIAVAGAGLKATPVAMFGGLLAVVTLVLGFFLTSLKREVPPRVPKPRTQTLAYRWSRTIQHHSVVAALSSTVVLLILALPIAGLRLGFSDESNFPEDTTTKQAYDLLVGGFGKGFNGPLLLVAKLPQGVGIDDLAPIKDAVHGVDGVAFVSDPVPNKAEPDAVLWNLFPTSGPQDAETQDLVDRLRDDVLPAAEQEAGVDVLVTGTVAGNMDFSTFLSGRLPWFFAAVLALSFLLLLAVFRSVLVPLKAVVMNLLSVGAAYGVIVALFQWAWLGDITGVQPAPIEPWAPMMLFAIVFGLSMDYEVFLLSRVREEWHRSGDSHRSVADGLAATAKVITAAAAIMVVVFGAFIFESDRTLKLMGTGLATAILLDATIVRMLLVPATMELLGDRNWWIPAWLDRIIPTLDVEGHIEDAAPLDDPDDERQLVDA